MWRGNHEAEDSRPWRRKRWLIGVLDPTPRTEAATKTMTTKPMQQQSADSDKDERVWPARRTRTGSPRARTRNPDTDPKDLKISRGWSLVHHKDRVDNRRSRDEIGVSDPWPLDYRVEAAIELAVVPLRPGRAERWVRRASLLRPNERSRRGGPRGGMRETEMVLIMDEKSEEGKIGEALVGIRSGLCDRNVHHDGSNDGRKSLLMHISGYRSKA